MRFPRRRRFRQDTRLQDASRTDVSYCEECGQWVHKDQMTCRPGFHMWGSIPRSFLRRGASGITSATVCRDCADRIEAAMPQCPNCGRRCRSDPQLAEDGWRACDSCGRSGCVSCFPIDLAPQSGGWAEEGLAWVCLECRRKIEERHADEREREFGDGYAFRDPKP